MHNFTYWSEHLFEQIMSGYVTVLGVFLWPLIFTAVIGYIYLKQQSYVAASVAALILLAVFSNAMAGIQLWINILYILVSLTFTGLVLIMLSKRRA